jgi:hypothetical protein
VNNDERRKWTAERLEELDFLLVQMRTPVPEVLRRLDFASIPTATSFARRNGRPDLARLIGLQGSHGDPYSERFDNALLIVEREQGRTFL